MADRGPARADEDMPRRASWTPNNSGGRSRRRLRIAAALLVEPARRSRGSSIAVDAAATSAIVVVARQPVGIVIDLNCRNGRNEGDRGHGDRGSLRLLHMMKSMVMLSCRVRRERCKSEAHRKNDRR